VIEVDTRGLKCPLPILKAKKALAGLEPGGLLRVVATDPGSVRDFQAFCKQTGHGLLSQDQVETSSGVEITHVIQRKA
jgi:tRNA 2-thiouridine synthesizing protein A